MKKLTVFLCCIIAIAAKAQTITGKIIDSASGQPLPFASIIFTQSQKFVYANAKGELSFNKDSVKANDTLIVSYLGYLDTRVKALDIIKKPVIKLSPSSRQLSNVVVENCSSVKQSKANYYRGRPSSYIGPGPETKIIIISHYTNDKKVQGYISKISFYSSVNSSIPVRLHWYEWNNVEQKPGKELTVTNLLYYSSKHGWNDFNIPEKAFYYDTSGIVLGIEFIYPDENKAALVSFKDEKEKLAWLNNLSHRWGLGMNDRSAKPSFYQVNYDEIKAYKKDNDKGYNQPALRIIVTVCKK